MVHVLELAEQGEALALPKEKRPRLHLAERTLKALRTPTEREIDVAVRDLVAKAFGQATDILRSRHADLEEGARFLLAQETLTADQFPAIRSAVQPAKAGGL